MTIGLTPERLKEICHDLSQAQDKARDARFDQNAMQSVAAERARVILRDALSLAVGALGTYCPEDEHEGRTLVVGGQS